jgi:glycine betaine/proline transport system ATP-binding protein
VTSVVEPGTAVTGPSAVPPASPGPVATAKAGGPTIAVRGLWKVFGPAEAKVARAGAGAGAAASREGLEQTVRDMGGTIAVEDVSFDVQPGEVFVVMGLSGSGKSTLVRCLTRLIEPTLGAVDLDGEDIRKASPERLRELRRRRFSMVFQNFGLLPHRRVLDNIAFGLELRGESKARRLERAGEMLGLVGLEGMAERYPDELSGGQQQRVGLARALAADPAVLLLDEPLGALDAITREDLQQVLIELWAGSQKTAVLITHDVEEAVFLATRLIVLSERPGRIVAGFDLPFSARIAAGEDPRGIRAEPDFTAAKAELRDLMDRRAVAGDIEREVVS